MSEPVLRPAGRALVIDARGRLLLIRSVDPSVDAPALWITPGGALEPGETEAEAARRELLEETGIDVPLASVGRCVFRRRHIWRWGARMIDSREAFFAVRLASAPEKIAVRGTGLELLVLKELRWWSLEELRAATGEVFVPREIARLVEPLLRGDEGPAEAIEVGE